MILVCAAGSAGCMPVLRGDLAPDEKVEFRAAALQFLREAAFSDDPILRMNALEAFQETAEPQGIACIEDNIDNGYAGVSFAALMAAGTLRDRRAIESIRTRAEDNDPSVRIAAIFSLHRMGDERRTSELSDLLLSHPDARVRANAALALGRLEEPKSVRLLRTALRREKKDAVKLQILEALTMLHDKNAAERLKMYGYSAAPDQAALALMFLANAKCADAEDLFRYRLNYGDQPELKLHAVRGLGALGQEEGMEVAAAHLYFRSPRAGRPNDPPQQQVSRVRQLAALALEAIGSPEALGPLRDAFFADDQSPHVRVAIARAALRIMRGRIPVNSVMPAPPRRSVEH